MRRIALVVGAVSILAAPAAADAFCGFYVGGAGSKLYNNATQVVMMRDGTRTVLSMANNYQGPPKDFAMVVPVPVILEKKNVKTLPSSIFSRIDKLTAPRLVEYWEQNPCPERRRYGRGGGIDASKASIATGAARSAPRKKRPAVRVEAKFTVGEYDIVILSADEATALYDWLKEHEYNIPKGADKVLKPYVTSGMKFFVAKVDIEKVKLDDAGKTMLSPLRFHYDSETFSLPIRLGLLNAKGKQDLIVHILAKNQRYEVSNYENVTIPTNIYIRKKTKPKFGSFYASLFDKTMAKNPGAVVTEYAWQANKCDPCPGPGAALTAAEIMTLGGDVVSGGGAAAASDAGAKKRRVRRRPPRTRGSMGWTVTRLHTRYDKDTLGEDLVFKAAEPIVGGREFRPKGGKRLERGASASTVNNFQARYIIRYKWRGPVKCKNPQWGIWGGPTDGRGWQQPGTAKDLAFVKDRKLALRNYVLQRIPAIGVKPKWKSRGKGKSDDDE